MGNRIRQHVNPLALYFSEPRGEPLSLPWDRRIEIELGCGEGDFSFELARLRPELHVVGLDIREAQIEANLGRQRREGPHNLTFAYANLAVDLEPLLGTGRVAGLHLLFPDPWFKARHAKRRVLDEALCVRMIDRLSEGGEIHMATDVFELALDAMEHLEAAPRLHNLHEPWSFAREGPWPVCSRREVMTMRRRQRVWRLRYRLASTSASRSGK